MDYVTVAIAGAQLAESLQNGYRNSIKMYCFRRDAPQRLIAGLSSSTVQRIGADCLLGLFNASALWEFMCRHIGLVSAKASYSDVMFMLIKALGGQMHLFSTRQRFCGSFV